MTKQILVIDTEDDMYSSLFERRFNNKIESGEYFFTYVDSPKSAWNMILATENKYDIIIMDIVYSNPSIENPNGFYLLGQIQHSQISIKPIIISAYTDLQNMREAMNRGTFDYISKPLDFDDLEKTIDRASTVMDVQRILDENQRMKIILEKAYHFLKNGSINSTWKIEKDVFARICKELGRENQFEKEPKNEEQDV